MGLVGDAMSQDVTLWKEKRLVWQRMLELLKSGKMKPGERVPGRGNA